MVSPDQQFLCDGQLTEWRYQGKRSNVSFRAIVWRPVDLSANVTQFKVVGINDIPAGAINTPVHYTVPANERIAVEAGDVIGWSFQDSVLAYSRGGDYRVRWVHRNLNGSLQMNQVHDISSGVEEREYSIAATVGRGKFRYPKRSATSGRHTCWVTYRKKQQQQQQQKNNNNNNNNSNNNNCVPDLYFVDARRLILQLLI